MVVEDLPTMPDRHRPEGDHHPSTSTTPGTTSAVECVIVGLAGRALFSMTWTRTRFPCGIVSMLLAGLSVVGVVVPGIGTRAGTRVSRLHELSVMTEQEVIAARSRGASGPLVTTRGARNHCARRRDESRPIYLLDRQRRAPSMRSGRIQRSPPTYGATSRGRRPRCSGLQHCG